MRGGVRSKAVVRLFNSPRLWVSDSLRPMVDYFLSMGAELADCDVSGNTIFHLLVWHGQGPPDGDPPTDRSLQKFPSSNFCPLGCNTFLPS